MNSPPHRSGWLVLWLLCAGTAPRVEADDVARAKKVEAHARDLLDPAATRRVEAARALGNLYPEGAEAVPLLVEAADDEDEAVRREAVVALRVLGRAGQQVAARESARFPEPTLRLMSLVGVLHSLGRMATDNWLLSLHARDGGADGLRAGLFALAAYPEHVLDPWARNTAPYRGAIYVALPFARSKDARMAEAARAALAMAGRTAVAGRDVGPSATSAPELLPLLGARHDAVRWFGWRLLAEGGPHDAATIDAILEAFAALPPETDDDTMAAPQLRMTRKVGLPTLFAVGRPAWEAIDEEYASQDVNVSEALSGYLRAGDLERAGAAWATYLEWIGGEPVGGALVGTEDLRWPQREPTLAAAVVPRIGKLLESIASSTAPLLDKRTKLPEGLPDDPAEAWDDGRRSHTIVLLAGLALRAPQGVGPPATRDWAVRTMRRALLLPGSPVRRPAALIVAGLGHGGPVPSDDLLRALGARLSREDPLTALALFDALASVGLPASGLAQVLPYLAMPPPAPGADPEEPRSEYTSFLPHLEAALQIHDRGLMGLAPAQIRLRAIDVVGGMTEGRDAARAALTPLASDPDPVVRSRVARALRRLGT
jgi:HEAT repeat protein